MLLRSWIFFCSSLVAGGWLLSVFKQLTPAGYVVLFLLLAVGYLLEFKFSAGGMRRSLARITRRLLCRRRLLPGVFAAFALLVLVKGLLVPPYHDDGLSYRIPRILNWLFEHQWYWIDAPNDSRLNTRGTVSEWLTAPILLFFRTDQLVFLPNWISFLFFPGLIFQVWRDWGVSPRLAWIWMWLLPAGFCYSMQAGNSSNDILATFFALAAFALLRRRRTVPPIDLLASLLSAALMTGTKLTMAPLLIPWAILIFPQLNICFQRPVFAFGALIWAALVSFLPTGLFNYLHYRDFSGLSQELSLQPSATYAERLVGNVFLMIFHNVIYADIYKSEWIKQLILNSDLGKMIADHFPTGTLVIFPFYSIEQTGLGLVVVAVGIYLFAITFTSKYFYVALDRLTAIRLGPALHIIIWILFFLFLLTSTATQPARLISGYYPFLLASFFLGSIVPQGRTRRWAKAIVCCGIAAVAVCLVFHTENPLLPDSDYKFFNSVRTFEETQVEFINHTLPASEEAIGLMRDWNQRESWAWKPYGSRRVYQLPAPPNLEQMKARRIHYILITSAFLGAHSKVMATWLRTHPHTLVACCLYNKDDTAGDYLIYLR